MTVRALQNQQENVGGDSQIQKGRVGDIPFILKKLNMGGGSQSNLCSIRQNEGNPGKS